LTQIKVIHARRRWNIKDRVSRKGIVMAFKDLLVHIDATAAGTARARIAAGLAEAHGAQLTGLFIAVPRMPPVDLATFTELGLEGGAYHRELERVVAEDERRQSECEAAFRAELARAKVEGEWLVVDGSTPHPIDAEARCRDLIIIGQARADEESKRLHIESPAELALAAGRPVLAVPLKGEIKTLGERVLVAWNGSREAARAVGDAMPFLEGARFVELIAVEPPGRPIDDGMRDLANLVRHLKDHGVKAERYVVTAPAHQAGEQILARASHADCDLIVMGAYGHSHMREIVLGGATRTLLDTMTIPLLLAH
jgi:nucleotide-binding universal stress UspA family protein